MGCGARLDGEPASHPTPTTQGTFIVEVMATACRQGDSCWTTGNTFSLGLVQLEVVTGEVGGSLPLEGFTTQLDKVTNVLI